MLVLRPLVGGTFAAISKLADSPELFPATVRAHASMMGTLLETIIQGFVSHQPSILDELFLEMIFQGFASHYLFILDSSLLACYWLEPQDTFFAIICWICAQHRFGLLLARYWPETQDTIFSYFVLRF